MILNGRYDMPYLYPFALEYKAGVVRYFASWRLLHARGSRGIVAQRGQGRIVHLPYMHSASATHAANMIRTQTCFFEHNLEHRLSCVYVHLRRYRGSGISRVIRQ